MCFGDLSWLPLQDAPTADPEAPLRLSLLRSIDALVSPEANRHPTKAAADAGSWHSVARLPTSTADSGSGVTSSGGGAVFFLADGQPCYSSGTPMLSRCTSGCSAAPPQHQWHAQAGHGPMPRLSSIKRSQSYSAFLPYGPRAAGMKRGASCHCLLLARQPTAPPSSPITATSPPSLIPSYRSLPPASSTCSLPDVEVFAVGLELVQAGMAPEDVRSLQSARSFLAAFCE